MNARKFKFITYFRARGKAIKVKKKNLVSIFACRLKQRRRPLYTGDTFSVSTISWFTDPLPSPSVSSRPAQLLAPRVNRSQATTRAGVGHRYETLHQVTFPSPPTIARQNLHGKRWNDSRDNDDDDDEDTFRWTTLVSRKDTGTFRYPELCRRTSLVYSYFRLSICWISRMWIASLTTSFTISRYLLRLP